jgi:hypothetical protein
VKQPPSSNLQAAITSDAGTNKTQTACHRLCQSFPKAAPPAMQHIQPHLNPMPSTLAPQHSNLQYMAVSLVVSGLHCTPLQKFDASFMSSQSPSYGTLLCQLPRCFVSQAVVALLPMWSG